MRLPDFLVIGAMKAGTTTLCHDLASHPEVYFPVTKEPHTLLLPEVLTPKGKERYAALFQRAEPNQLCGEGSTGYTKLPDSAAAPGNARAVLGEALKLVYILRNPIARSISHHYHLFRAGEAPASFRDAIEQNPLIVSVSCYGRQLEAWLDEFPREQLHLLRFEDYMKDRQNGVREVWRFLGCSDTAYQLEEEGVFNAGSEQLLPPASLGGIKNKIARSQWYKRNVAPILSAGFKEKVKSLLYRRNDARPDAPTPADIDLLKETFAEDLPRLREIVGPGFPLWELEELHTLPR